MAFKPMDVPQFEFIGEHKVIKASTKEGGWNTEFNKVSWSGSKAKYDIRQWSPDHTRMSKGTTFTAKEALTLRNILNDIDLEAEVAADDENNPSPAIEDAPPSDD